MYSGQLKYSAPVPLSWHLNQNQIQYRSPSELFVLPKLLMKIRQSEGLHKAYLLSLRVYFGLFNFTHLFSFCKTDENCKTEGNCRIPWSGPNT